MMAKPAGELTEMVGAYVVEKTGVVLTPGMYSAFAVINDKNDFCAGVVVTNFRGTDCEISCAGETPVAWKPWVMRAVFQYVFQQLGCVRCTAITTKRNKRARRFLEGLGFELEGKVRQGYDGKIDALIYGLLASECRYIAVDEGDSLDGQEVVTGSTGSTGPGSNSGGAEPVQQGRGDYAGELEPHRSSDPARIADVHSEWI